MSIYWSRERVGLDKSGRAWTIDSTYSTVGGLYDLRLTTWGPDGRPRRRYVRCVELLEISHITPLTGYGADPDDAGTLTDDECLELFGVA